MNRVVFDSEQVPRVTPGPGQHKHWSCCGWPKGTSWDAATLNSEEIKPVAIAIIELHLSEGISQSDIQSVENSVK